jgi:ribosomal protein S18 acetylase RimI-like enzyme
VPVRAYNRDFDYEKVDRFLVEIYRPEPFLSSWLQPRWEYMHYHSLSVGLPFERFGVAEDDGQMIGLVHFEHNSAFNYLQLRPGYEHIAGDLLEWADHHLGGESVSFGRRVLGIYVDDSNVDLEVVMLDRGFEVTTRFSEASALYVINEPIPESSLPDGFELASLEDDNDLAKINRVLWRGFDHEGPPPGGEIPGREHAQRAPNFRRDLTIVAVAPNGDYASFAGMWVVAENRVAYVEPVATDPAYRRMGLGRAAVLESIRRAGAGGARVASDQKF